MEEEAVHQESTGAFVAVPEASGASDKEKEGHGPLEKVVDLQAGCSQFLEGGPKVAAYGRQVGGAENGNLAGAEDAFFQGFASGSEELEFEGDIRGERKGVLLHHLEEQEERFFLVQDLLGFGDLAPSDGDAVEKGLDFGNREGVAFHHADVVDDLGEDFLARQIARRVSGVGKGIAAGFHANPKALNTALGWLTESYTPRCQSPGVCRQA